MFTQDNSASGSGESGVSEAESDLTNQGNDVLSVFSSSDSSAVEGDGMDSEAASGDHEVIPSVCLLNTRLHCSLVCCKGLVLC